MPSSGRCRAAAMNFCDSSPSCAIDSEPLRSCSRKLKPEAAPKPASVGMLNGKITASGIAASCGRSPPMMPLTCSAAVVRSSQGFMRTKIVP